MRDDELVLFPMAMHNGEHPLAVEHHVDQSARPLGWIHGDRLPLARATQRTASLAASRISQRVADIMGESDVWQSCAVDCE